MEKIKKQNGITLIALVITIIVLVILSGIAISALTNEKSIIGGANSTKIEYKKESMLEAIKSAEVQIRLDNQLSGEEINISNLIEKIKQISDINDKKYRIDVYPEESTATIADKETGIVIDITMDENGKTTTEVSIVDDISKVTRPTITYETIPQENGNVLIKITVTEEENGITKIQFPDNTEKTYSNEKEVVEEFIATENGTYKFTAQSANGRTASKSIEVTNTLTAADIDIQILTTEPTQGPTEVKIVYDENAKIGGETLTNEDRYRYKIGDGNWETSSTAEITVPVNSNTTIFAQYYTGTQGYKTTTATVSNIDTASPQAFNLSTTVTTNSIQISGTTEDVGIEGTAAGNIGISGYSFKLSDSEGNVIVDWTPEQAGGSYTFSTNETLTITHNTTYKVSMKAIDLAGNEKEATNANESVITTPVADSREKIGISYSPETATQGPVNVTFTNNSGDDSLTLKYQKEGETSWTTYTEPVTMTTNGYVYARLFDTQGQYTNTATVNINNIDTASPQAFNLSTTVTTNSIQISGTTEDIGIEGTAESNIDVRGYSFKLSDSAGNVIVDWTPEQAGGSYTFSTNETLTITHNTTYKVSIKAIDLAGNEKEATNANESVTTTAVVDSEANIGISYSPSTATQGPVNVTFTNNSGNDDLILKYQKEGETSWTTYTDPIPMATNGYVYARLFDTQGQYTNTATATVSNIDLDAPQTPTLTSSSVTETTFTLTATAQDSASTTTSTSSGISKYEFYINGSKYATNTTGVCNVTGRTGSTTYTCKVIVYDGVNRSTSSANLSVKTATVYTAYSVGQAVTVKGVAFYVMEASSASSSTVKLIRKDSISGEFSWNVANTQANAYAQSTLGYTTAQATSRLITYDEAVALQSANSNLLYGREGYSSSTYLMYWTSSSNTSDTSWFVNGKFSRIATLYTTSSRDVRPVLIIQKSLI